MLKVLLNSSQSISASWEVNRHTVRRTCAVRVHGPGALGGAWHKNREISVALWTTWLGKYVTYFLFYLSRTGDVFELYVCILGHLTASVFIDLCFCRQPKTEELEYQLETDAQFLLVKFNDVLSAIRHIADKFLSSLVEKCVPLTCLLVICCYSSVFAVYYFLFSFSVVYFGFFLYFICIFQQF